MRIKHKVNVRVALDTDMKNMLFGFDDTLAEVQIDTYEKQASGVLKILANTSEDVPLGDIDAVKGAYLRLDKEATIKINGSTDAIQLRKYSTSSSAYAKFFIEADITQLNITAPTTEDVNGIFCAWGDATS